MTRITSEIESNDLTIIYGPPASGKTRNAKELAAHYQCDRIIDTGIFGQDERLLEQYLTGKKRYNETLRIILSNRGVKPEELNKTLILCHQRMDVPPSRHAPRQIPIREALAAIGKAA